MKHIFLILFVIFYINANAQTCIVALMTKSNIYIGADSKVPATFYRIQNGATLMKDSILKECKIFKHGYIFYSGAGQRVKFLNDVLDSCIRYGNSISEIVALFKLKGKIKLEDSLQEMKSFSTEQYKSFFKFEYFNNLLICGFEKGSPFLYKIDFGMGNKIDEQKVIVTSNLEKKGLISENDIYTIAIGHSECVEAPISIKDKDYTMDIYRIIEKQIYCTPQSVGKPISVVKISKDSAELSIEGICSF